MRIQIVRSAFQKTTAILACCMMVASLSFPLTALASEATTPQNDDNPPPSNNLSNKTVPTSTAGAGLQPTSSAENSSPAATQPTGPQPSQQTQSDQPEATSNSTPQSQDNGPQTSTNVDANAPTTQTSAETDASLSNNIDSAASSGNATAHQNTTVGNVTTGNAAALATIVNLLQSNVNLNGAQPITFIQDVTGTVQGDIIVDPEVIASLDTTSPLFTDNGTSPSTDINTSTNASIANNINITASSGNANATQNTTAGNVQSGSASAVANVVNIINSAIQANQSFVGMINIYGNLQGNILVPEAFVNSVLGTGTNAPAQNGPVITTDNNTSVINNVNTTATSGSASATDNSSTGTVATGQANTNVTILNLTSNQTVGKNALLVFVNVMGNWVGLILDAPAGTTSASLGGSSSSSGQNAALPGSIDATNNYQVNNNINASAQSGAANAHENTTVGNIQSGNASAGVNLVNILNSQISLSDWFGILFINVFGSWNGNFGVQTATATPPTDTPGAGNSGTGTGGTGSPSTASPAVFRFVPSNERNYTVRTLSLPAAPLSTDAQYAPDIYSSPGQQMVLGANNAATSNNGKGISLQNSKDSIEEQGLRWWWLPLAIATALLFAIRFYLVRRRMEHAGQSE